MEAGGRLYGVHPFVWMDVRMVVWTHPYGRIAQNLRFHQYSRLTVVALLLAPPAPDCLLSRGVGGDPKAVSKLDVGEPHGARRAVTLTRSCSRHSDGYPYGVQVNVCMAAG